MLSECQVCGRGAWREKPTHPNRAGCPPAQPPPQLGRRLRDLPLFWGEAGSETCGSPCGFLSPPPLPALAPSGSQGGGGGAEGQRCRRSPPWPPLSRPPHAPGLPLPQRCTQPSSSALSVGGSSQMRQRKGPVLEQFSVPTLASHTGRPFPSQPPQTHLYRGFIGPASGQPVGSAWYLKPPHSSELLSRLRGGSEGCWEDRRGAGWGILSPEATFS